MMTPEEETYHAVLNQTRLEAQELRVEAERCRSAAATLHGAVAELKAVTQGMAPNERMIATEGKNARWLVAIVSGAAILCTAIYCFSPLSWVQQVEELKKKVSDLDKSLNTTVARLEKLDGRLSTSTPASTESALKVEGTVSVQGTLPIKP